MATTLTERAARRLLPVTLARVSWDGASEPDPEAEPFIATCPIADASGSKVGVLTVGGVTPLSPADAEILPKLAVLALLERIAGRACASHAEQNELTGLDWYVRSLERGAMGESEARALLDELAAGACQLDLVTKPSPPRRSSPRPPRGSSSE